MNCETARGLLESYLDDELDASAGAQLQDHLANCGACKLDRERLLALRTEIRNSAMRYHAPAQLEEQIRAALRRANRPPAAVWRSIGMAASLLLAASLAWNAALLRSRGSGAGAVAQEVLASHIRSLMGGHLTDVASSDRHNVKPWFNGKLDFSPDVKDLATQGFPLVGGRLEYVAGHPAAALVYGHRQHVINLLTWPSSPSQPRLAETSRNGYHAIHWNQGGMEYWAVSDLGDAELRQFAELYK